MVALVRAGVSQRRIDAHLQFSQSMVTRPCARFQETASNKDRPKSGRRRVSTPAPDRKLTLASRLNRFKTSPVLKEEQQRTFGPCGIWC